MTTTPAPKGADIEQYRAGFEAWARKETFSLELDGAGYYLFSDTLAAWSAWRAAKRESGSSTSTSQGAKLRAAVETVCEGWTLPHDARKVLETALWSHDDGNSGAAPGDALDAARLEYVLAHGRPMKWFDNDDRNVWRYMHINEWSNSAIEAIDKARSAIAASTRQDGEKQK